MFSTDDSIVAIATPPGRGGIGVVRVSGSSALEIARRLLECRTPLEPRRATYTRARGLASSATAPCGDVLDEVVATYFPAPHSYTGEHVVEISAHGSPVVLEAIVQRAITAGARLARPGEFTLRAFLNGKRDLVQAEAVGDLIAAATPLQARVAFDQLEGTLTARIAAIDAQLFDLIARLEASLDFSDEGYHFVEPAEAARAAACVAGRVSELLCDGRRGRMIREGATVVVAGRTNVGKSSLFNVLAGNERAIVTDVAGTTRDLVTERIDFDGLALTIVDTAGWRETRDVVEREGVERAVRAQEVADLLLLVLDRSEPLTRDDERLLASTNDRARIVVVNKSDCAAATGFSWPNDDGVLVSARTGAGIAALRQAIQRALTGSEALRDTAAISNTRHIALLEEARTRLTSAQRAAETGHTPEEFVLADLQAARECFDEVVGARTPDDLLEHIFSTFCIGK
ncbi:MAG: tRNA uridine-5-carboxymethylaminomethyl(34) synthesis GTPase MnmE [Acidobacteria bacterium]|nr:tRNA uridine-5-carboxymethylaminomethyl(34) synthesis GTPase MnmE [Acidobacteriota bacterium]